MEFLKDMRSLQSAFPWTPARRLSRAVTKAVIAEGGRAMGVRLDRLAMSAPDVEKPVSDSFFLFQANGVSEDRGCGNTDTRLLLRVVIIPAPPSGDRERGPFLVVAQPVTQWEWLTYDQMEDSSLWVLSSAAVAATEKKNTSFASTTISISSPPFDVLAGDLSGNDKLVCDAFERLRQHMREKVLHRFPQCQHAAPVAPSDDNNCEPCCEETVLVRRPPFPSESLLLA